MLEKPMAIREAWAQYMTIVGAARVKARRFERPDEGAILEIIERERAQEIVEQAIRAPLEAALREALHQLQDNGDLGHAVAEGVLAAALAGVPKEAE